MSVLKAIYKGGSQSGGLGPAQVRRALASRNPSGAAVLADMPRSGAPCYRVSPRAWTVDWVISTGSAQIMSGYDADGLTPMLAYWQGGPARLEFWLTDFSGGTPDATLSIRKDGGADTLINAFDVSSGSWSGGSATLTLDAEHAITTAHTLRVSGVTPAGYNGDFAVTAETATTVTYVVADPGGVASGGIAGRRFSETNDVVAPTASEIANTSHSFRGGVVIPGAFIFYCDRAVDRNAGVGDRDWQSEGVSLIMFDTGDPALPYDPGTAVITILDLPGTNLAPGWTRGAPWAVTGWFPFDHTQTTASVDRIILPIVDYLNDSQQPSSQKPGGQLWYVELTRASGVWSFAKSFLMFERSEDEVHFHSAAWTPNGIVLAMGDSPAQNETLLFTPKGSWDDVHTAESFDVHRHWQGAGSDDANPTEAPQWAGNALGDRPNDIIVGNDLSSANAWLMTVPDDPDDGPGFRSMGGFHRSRDLTGGTNLNLWMGVADPWKKDRCFVIRPNGSDPVDLSRLWYTSDNERFAPIARVPTDTLSGAWSVPFGDRLVLSSRIAGSDTYSLLPPKMRGPTSGLAVSRGATNELRLSAGALIGVVVGTGQTVTRITDGLHPTTGEPLNAPGFGPVYHCTTGITGLGDIFEFNPTDAATFSPAYAVLTAHIMLIGQECWNGSFVLEDSDSSPAEVFAEQFKICELQEWVPVSQHFPADGFGGIYNPLMTVRWQGTTPRPSEFLIQIEGYYSGELPPYPMDENTTGADENVWQNLPATMSATAWAVVCECTIEPWSPDPSVLGVEGDSFTIMTIFGSDDERIDITYSAAVAGTINALIYNGGVLQDTLVIADQNVMRSDKLWIGVSMGAGGTRLVASTGSREAGFVDDTSLFANNLAVAPRRVKFGGNAMDDVMPLSANIVGVNTDTQLTTAQMLALLEDDSDDETFGVGIPTAPTLANDPSVDVTETSGAGTTSVSVTVAAGQVLVASVHSRDATAAEHLITSVVFNTSETMTQEELHLQTLGTDNQVAIYTLHNPTATTANVTVNWTTTPERARLHVYIIDNADIQEGSFVEGRDGEFAAASIGVDMTLKLNTSPNALVLLAHTLEIGEAGGDGRVPPGIDGAELFTTDWTTFAGGTWGSSFTNVPGGIVELGSDWTVDQEYSAAIIAIRGGRVSVADTSHRNRERPIRRDTGGFGLL